jgi:branched-chain amino acid transport system substrate-binding protein
MNRSHPIKIGLLFSKIGRTAPLESSQLRGAMQAIDEINRNGGIGGRELIPIWYEPESNARLFRMLAERLFLRDGVNVIFGGYTSTSRKAMLPVVEKQNKLLFYPQQYEGFEFSEHIIYGGAAPNQNGIQLAEFLTDQFGARIYMVGSRYVYPYECNRNMQELILQAPEGAILGEKYLNLDATYEDFEYVIGDIKKKQPDFVFSTVIGETVSHLYKAYARAGLSPERMPIGSLNTSETEISMMGVEFGRGHFTSAPYFQSVDTPENHSALKEFKNSYGETMAADMNWEAAYYQVHLFGKAMRIAGSDEFSRIVPELRGLEYVAPQGRVQIDPVNQHTSLNPKIGRANSHGEFEILRESRRMVSPDPYMATQAVGDWVTKLTATER